MAIVGWSEVRYFPRKGKIHMGERDAQGTPHPTDYFVTDDPKIHEVYGEEPRLLHVRAPVNDIDRVCNQSLQCYSAQRRWCEGTGVVAQRVIEDGSGYEEIACPYQECQYYRVKKGRSCREMSMLQVILPKVASWGVYQIDTSSYYGSQNVRGMLEHVQAALGTILGVTMTLEIVEKNVLAGDQRRTVRVLWLDVPMPLEELERQRAHMLPAGQQIQGLGAGQVLRPPMSIEPDDPLAGPFKGEQTPEPEKEWQDPRQIRPGHEKEDVVASEEILNLVVASGWTRAKQDADAKAHAGMEPVGYLAALKDKLGQESAPAPPPKRTRKKVVKKTTEPAPPTAEPAEVVGSGFEF